MLAGLWSDTAASGCGGWPGSHTQWLPVTGRVRSLVAGILLAATSPPLSNTVAEPASPPVRRLAQRAELTASSLCHHTLPLNWASTPGHTRAHQGWWWWGPTANMSKFTGLTCRYWPSTAPPCSGYAGFNTRYYDDNGGAHR